MHGIVYVPESEAPSDPLEAEGMSYIPMRALYKCVHGIIARKCCYIYGKSKCSTLLDERFRLEG